MDEIIRMLMMQNGRLPGAQPGEPQMPPPPPPGDIWTGSDQDAAMPFDPAWGYPDSDAAWLAQNQPQMPAQVDGDVIGPGWADTDPNAFQDGGGGFGTQDGDVLNPNDPYFDQLRKMLNSGRPAGQTGGSTGSFRGDG